MPSTHVVSTLPVSAAAAFAWHARPGALPRLIPPWQHVELVSRTGSIMDGDRTVLRLHLGPFTKRWVARHQRFQPGISFCDVQESGPFAAWEHTHTITPGTTPDTCTLTDHINWQLPWFARWAQGLTQRELARQFAWRHRRTAQDLARHVQTKHSETVAISGSSGLIGSSLAPFLTGGGHTVRRLVRGNAQTADECSLQSPSSFADCTAVIHLGGAGIADRRWSNARKAELQASRIDGTRALCETLARLPTPPRVLLCASAIGLYGIAGDPADESTPPGDGFLPDLCRAWEAACEPARAAGIHVVHLRFGVVLAARGGALNKMLPAFRCGLGGPIGTGRQMMPWIGLDDALGAILHLLNQPDASGAFNLVAPECTDQRTFATTLGRVLCRPTFAPMPAPVVRLLFGEMGDTLLLNGRSVMPRRLSESGFTWLTPTLESCLRWELGSG